MRIDTHEDAFIGRHREYCRRIGVLQSQCPVERVECLQQVEPDRFDEPECLRFPGPVCAERPGTAQELASDHERRIGLHEGLAVAFDRNKRQHAAQDGEFGGRRLDDGQQVRVDLVDDLFPVDVDIDPARGLFVGFLAGRRAAAGLGRPECAREFIDRIEEVLDVAVLESGAGRDHGAACGLASAAHDVDCCCRGVAGG